jgi:outer membrane protein OmpA-like peptidoglycan-associated protein
MRKITFIIAATFILISTNLFPQNIRDVAGCKDNILISRLKGSSMQFCKTVNWDTYILPYSKIISVEGTKTWEKKLKLQGEINRIQYITDKSNNSTFVFANYLSAIKNANWNILFSGSGDNELGNESFEWQYYMFGNEGFDLGDKIGSKYSFRGGNYAYIAAKYEDDDATYFASIYIIEQENSTMINQDIITVKNPDVGLVTAKSMTEKIDNKGHIALDGLFFDTGKTILIDKSIPALKNIAEYLNKNQDKKFLIIGHTDNVGDIQFNITLSENRAKAVMKELITNYGVNNKQLEAYGIANFSPMISNKTEEGRAKNRRVEIVEQ